MFTASLVLALTGGLRIFMLPSRAATEEAYADTRGNPYNGYVTVAKAGKSLATTWWRGGRQMTGESKRNNNTNYFDPKNDGLMVWNKDLSYKLPNENEAYWYRYDADGNKVYGNSQKDGFWSHYNSQTGKQDHGWYHHGDGRWSFYNLDDGHMKVNTQWTDNTMDFGATYDFDANCGAHWHLPTYDDIPAGSRYPNQPNMSELSVGDRRQRVLRLALSRTNAPYGTTDAPNIFVCDGLTEWAYLNASGETRSPFSADYQWQLIKDRGGLKGSLDDFKPGDLVFFDSSKVTEGPDALGNADWPAYHAGIYYHDGKMIDSETTYHSGVGEQSVVGYTIMGYLGGGSPYAGETSKADIPH